VRKLFVRPPTEASIARLEALGLVARVGDRPRTTRRWQSAMARAAKRLFEANDPGTDLRKPIVSALMESCGDELTDEEIADLVHAMLPIELFELLPRETESTETE